MNKSMRFAVTILLTSSTITALRAWAADTESLLPHNPDCTLNSFLRPARGVPPIVSTQLAPTGTMKVAFNAGNPNNGKVANGHVQGLAVDFACILARRLGLEVQFVPYPGVPPMLQGFTNGDWTLGFAFDPQLGPQNFAYAHPYVGVENTYLVPLGSTFQNVSDVDQPGVQISVATGNTPDVYLTAHLQNATLIRFPTVPEALAALQNGQVNAFAGSRSAEVAFQAQFQGRLLQDDFLVALLAPVMAMDQSDALRQVNQFIEQSKVNFLIQLGIARAGLVGDTVPDPAREDLDQR